MEDRRKFPRFKVGVEVTWKKISQTERTGLHISHSKDLSAGGVCLVLHSSIGVGDLLELEIAVAGARPIRANGKVVWINRQTVIPGYKDPVCEGGVQFLDLSDTDRAALEQLSIKNASHK